jgi:hypothetical protein
MAYGIRLATGEVQMVTDARALTSELVDALLCGSGDVVWVDARCGPIRLDVLQDNRPPGLPSALEIPRCVEDQKLDTHRQGWRRLHLEVEGWSEDEYIVPSMAGTFRYTTDGPLRGRCGHKHKDLESALECLDADERLCVARGGHTDRQLFAIGPGGKRDLDADELAAVVAYRAAPRAQVTE